MKKVCILIFSIFTAASITLYAQEIALDKNLADAIDKSDIHSIFKLIKQGANPNHPGTEAVTALICAVSENDTTLIRLLISKGAYIDAVAAGDFTALMFAARSGHIEATVILIEFNAASGMRNVHGKTAYDIAVENNHKTVADLLKRYGMKQPKPEGIILGSSVFLREKPDVRSRALTQLEIDDSVVILEWTQVKEKHGLNEDRWVKVLTRNGKTGYIFGAYLFDMKDFHVKHWALESCAGFGMSIIFKSDGTCEITQDCSEPECGEPEIFTGSYDLAGREVIIHGSKPRYDIRDLFLYRMNGKNVLTGSPHEIDNHDFMKGIGDCGFWYQVK